MAVATMVVGEISSFVMRADYGYNSALPESLPKVGVGDTLIYEIELMKFNPQPTPRFPSQEELAISKKERQEEAEEEVRMSAAAREAKISTCKGERRVKGKRIYNQLRKGFPHNIASR